MGLILGHSAIDRADLVCFRQETRTQPYTRLLDECCSTKSVFEQTLLPIGIGLARGWRFLEPTSDFWHAGVMVDGLPRQLHVWSPQKGIVSTFQTYRG